LVMTCSFISSAQRKRFDRVSGCEDEIMVVVGDPTAVPS
jgi:hypothetical protein